MQRAFTNRGDQMLESVRQYSTKQSENLEVQN